MEEQTITVEHTPTPWTTEVGDRFSDGDDCWVIDSELGSIAEMQCPADVEEANARFIVEAVNNYDSLRARVNALEVALNGQRNINDCWCYVIEESKKQKSKNFVHDVQCDRAREALGESPKGN